MALPIKINEKCLVRHQDCKRIFSGSRICFVACPNSEEIALELEIIRQKLREVNIEPYIAIDQREFQKDIYCEKICTKIIESQFCIVILNDSEDPKDKVRKPNANVYYEYGLMTAFRKNIIPIQLLSQSLAFNIQSLDTLKYNRKDFSPQIEEAIKMTMLSLEDEQKAKDSTIEESKVEWTLDLMGLVRADDRYRFRHERVLASKSLGFQPFTRPRDGKLYYVGMFEAEDNDKDLVLRAKMLTLRIKNYCEQMNNELTELRDLELKRSRPFTSERVDDLLRGKSAFTNATILIVKENIDNRDAFLKSYSESVKDLDFSLNIDVLDDEKITELLEV